MSFDQNTLAYILLAAGGLWLAWVLFGDRLPALLQSTDSDARDEQQQIGRTVGTALRLADAFNRAGCPETAGAIRSDVAKLAADIHDAKVEPTTRRATPEFGARRPPTAEFGS